MFVDFLCEKGRKYQSFTAVFAYIPLRGSLIDHLCHLYLLNTATLVETIDLPRQKGRIPINSARLPSHALPVQTKLIVSNGFFHGVLPPTLTQDSNSHECHRNPIGKGPQSHGDR
jgi:hypothetical protein